LAVKGLETRQQKAILFNRKVLNYNFLSSIWADRKADMHARQQADIQVDSLAGNQEADGKTDRQDDGQMQSQTGMQTNRRSINLSGGQAEIRQC
jgi:hypothetical protein